MHDVHTYLRYTYLRYVSILVLMLNAVAGSICAIPSAFWRLYNEFWIWTWFDPRVFPDLTPPPPPPPPPRCVLTFQGAPDSIIC